MTAFCGVAAFTESGQNRAIPVIENLHRALSRNPKDALHAWRKGCVQVVHYDIRAGGLPDTRGRVHEWGDGQHPSGIIFVKVCGDPVLESGYIEDDVAGTLFDRYNGCGLEKSILEFCKDARGTFNIVASDGRTLIIATDKYASRPVYWYRDQDIIVFSSVYRALIKSIDVRLTRDSTALAEVTCLRQPLGSKTIFNEVAVLSPGHALVVDTKDTRVKGVCYHKFVARNPEYCYYSDALNNCHETFIESVRLRARCASQSAFLTGGLDSRAIVAALVEVGCQVRTFNSSFPGSADEVISKMVADECATEHVVMRRTPAERVRYEQEPFGLYAREHFLGETTGAASMWSGDGGSVGLGLVYMTETDVERIAEDPLRKETILGVFPKIKTRGFRCVRKSRRLDTKVRAIDSLAGEFRKLSDDSDGKLLYLFYLHNDQMRHLYQHYEDIDLSRVELITPFFDSRLTELILQIPTSWLLYHRFYNDWISCFNVSVGAIPWQAYPGHVPCPLPLPNDIKPQWCEDWYNNRETRLVLLEVLEKILSKQGGYCQGVLNYTVLRAIGFTLRIGQRRFYHEIEMARLLSDMLEPNGG